MDCPLKKTFFFAATLSCLLNQGGILSAANVNFFESSLIYAFFSAWNKCWTLLSLGHKEGMSMHLGRRLCSIKVMQKKIIILSGKLELPRFNLTIYETKDSQLKRENIFFLFELKFDKFKLHAAKIPPRKYSLIYGKIKRHNLNWNP